MNVATGRARASWYLSTQGLSLHYSFGSGPNVKRGKSEGKFNKKFTGFDRFVELISGVPYIIYLEYGYSRQAPTGMVRISMREMTGRKLPQDMGKKFRENWRKFRL